MGGLKASEGFHVPKYQWEMLYAETGEPFMHFIVRREVENFSMEACSVPGGCMQIPSDWTAGQ